MILIRLKVWILIFSLFLIKSISAYAQAETDSLDDVRYGFLPALSFNSDRGIIAGTEVQRFDYRGDDLPFNNYSKAYFYYNSIGSYSLNYSRDQVKTFGSNVRSSINLESYLGSGDYFPGITVREGFDKQRLDSSSYYVYSSFRLKASVSTRIPWFLGSFIKRSDTKIGFEFDYLNPFDLETVSYLNEKRPSGYDYSRLFLTEIGFIVERRNSEFQAQSGYTYGGAIKGAIPLISSHNFGSSILGGAYYLPLIASRTFNLTWASRMNLAYTFGDVPFWYLPNIGGSNLRGHMWLREIGYGSLNYSSELRSWLFRIPFKDIRLGVNLFMDGGSVYDRNVNILEPHLLTIGFGGVMSIFTPDYIMKFDIGFSDEFIGVYIGTGYSF